MIIDKDLSYEIVGILMKVHTYLGSGYQEKHYQRAVAFELRKSHASFQEQLKTELYYEEALLGTYFLDFLIKERIVLEIKAKKHLHARDFRQVSAYLKAHKLKLGILANFGKDRLEFKRILNGRI